jgi:hypothetical protein
MMRIAAVATCYVGLLTGAAMADPPSPPPAPSAAVLPSESDPTKPIKQVALDPNAPYPVCRKVAPTGSRIKNEVCVTPNPDDKAREAERAQIRRDMDEMRARQAMRDQARAHALAEAMRRR